jgi:hypothetical protein
MSHCVGMGVAMSDWVIHIRSDTMLINGHDLDSPRWMVAI